MKKKLQIKIRAFLLVMLTSCFATAQTAQCFQEVSGGVFHTLAIAQNGSLWAWGDNLYGALGDGTTINKNIPTQIGNDTNWSKISAGQEFSFAIKTDGTLWAWGLNNYSVLGNNSASPLYIPTQIGTATNWKEVSAGTYAVVAIKTDGTLWAWGSNSYQELVSTVFSNIIPVPTQIGLETTWSKIDKGNTHTIAIKTNGSLWSWGIDYYGETGTGLLTPSIVNIPTQIGTATNWSSISAGVGQSLALKTDGTLFAWGFNENGQVGDGTLINKNLPTQIGTATNWNRISAGTSHCLAQKTNGTLWAWGYNNRGQLGDGTQTNRNIPTQVGTQTNWNAVGTGSFQSFSIKSDGSLWAMGWNNYGQLGDGTSDNRNVPISIACPTSLATSDFLDAINTISLYPNPVKDVLYITTTTPIVTIVIYNSLGQEVKSVIGNQSQIDVSTIQTGIYLVKIITNDNQETVKIVKE
jgi:alpha-tubulin suppressor-like RCC1 family protein